MPATPLLLLLAATAGVTTAAPAAAQRTFDVAEGSTISYRVVHKLHEVEGVSKTVEGKARLLSDGSVQVMVRVRIDSFDSGNSNRDAHMKEVTEAARLPFVLLKAVAEELQVVRYPADLELPLRGVLEFHGVTREIGFVAHVHFASADRATVEATFPVSLTEHRVERPSLLFVKVDDGIDVTARLSLTTRAP